MEQINTSGMMFVFFLCEYCGGLFEYRYWRGHIKSAHGISEMHLEDSPRVFVLVQQ